MKHGLFFAASMLLAVGCVEDVEPLGQGALQLTWEINPRGCSGAGVETVKAYIDGEIRGDFECSAFSGLIRDVDAGAHSVTLEGFDAKGTPIFTDFLGSLVVKPEAITEAPLAQLSAKRAEVNIFWQFEIADCMIATRMQTQTKRFHS